MERLFQINWPALVEEAKQRRKGLKLTQKRLATLAGVSTPTISRFESGKEDIQLSTVQSILTVLGMTDPRVLVFPEPTEYYDPNRMAIVFTGKDRDHLISCAISREALEDHFNADNKDPLKVFAANRERIEHKIRKKYLAGQVEADGSVLVKSGDF